jgi:hypothetical protein
LPVLKLKGVASAEAARKKSATVLTRKDMARVFGDVMERPSLPS